MPYKSPEAGEDCAGLAMVAEVDGFFCHAHALDEWARECAELDAGRTAAAPAHALVPSRARRAAFHVDLESLLPGHESAVVITPRLLLNGLPVEVSAAHGPQVVVRSVDMANVSSTKVVSTDRLSFHGVRPALSTSVVACHARDAHTDGQGTMSCSFSVPDNLASLAFELQLTGKHCDVGVCHSVTA